LDPGDPPQYVVLVDAWTRVRGVLYLTYPTMTPDEAQFLGIHYVKIKTFEGGNLHGPWLGLVVEVYQLR